MIDKKRWMKMKILHYENLAKYTTIKIGGNAKNFYIPENEKELLSLVRDLNEYKILGGGSNLLINDRITFSNVIYTKEFNKKFHIYPNLPYVLLFKDGGRVSRYLQQTCILDDACFSERLNMFTN